MDSRTEDDKTDPSQHNSIPEFTKNEIQDAIDRLKERESERQQWNTSWAVEQLQWRYEGKIRTIFNEIAQQEDFTPKWWRKICIQVIYKKGDREDAGNYTPICSLPVLCKLFATVLYARLAPSLHKIQPPDQGGFRPNHRTDDHLMVYRVLEQRCREWGVPLYISTIDFTKAFDRIKHSALWNSLHNYGVEPAHVRLLQRLYSQQEGTVLTEREWHISDQKRNEARWATVLLTLYHSVAIFSERRSEATAGKTKRPHIERPKRRLPDELEIRRRCITFLHVAGEITRTVMWVQDQHGSRGSGNPPRQDEDTQ